MITELRIENARIYEGEWVFPFSGLTILCGTNNAGKSTILRSLLLLRQNLVLRESSFGRRAHGFRLRFASELADLGSFRSFVSHNDTDRDLHLGVTITSHIPQSSFKILESVVDDRPPTPTGLFATTAETREPDGMVPYLLEADFRFAAASSARATNSLTSDGGDLEGAADRAWLKSAAFNIRSLDGTALLHFDIATHYRYAYELRVPAGFLSAVNYPVDSIGPDSNNPIVSLDISDSGILPDRVANLFRSPDKPGPMTRPLPPILFGSLEDLWNCMNTISYLGPSRAPARRYYQGFAESNPFHDSSGELFPILLKDSMRSTLVSAAHPLSHRPAEWLLEFAINTWLEFLRTGKHNPYVAPEQEIKLDPIQESLIGMQVRSSSGEIHSLADSGFGYSQVLPIVIRGLLLAPGSTLLIEQPEVHLNPALQVRLADFLVAMSSVGKQIIIETHSEHILNAIRAITAEKSSMNNRAECTVLYIEAPEGQPILHKLNVQPDGTIPEVPQSFFGEAAHLLGRILRAQRKKT